MAFQGYQNNQNWPENTNFYFEPEQVVHPIQTDPYRMPCGDGLEDLLFFPRETNRAPALTRQSDPLTDSDGHLPCDTFTPEAVVPQGWPVEAPNSPRVGVFTSPGATPPLQPTAEPAREGDMASEGERASTRALEMMMGLQAAGMTPSGETEVALAQDLAPVPGTEVALARDVASPTKEDVSFAKNTESSTESDMAVDTDVVLPVESKETPARDSILFRETERAPPINVDVAPAEGVISLTEMEMALAKDIVSPTAKELALSSETQVAPGKDVAPPPETQVAPGKDMAPPPETVVAPGKDMAPPPETVVAPGKDVAPPPETVVAPGKDVAPPPETQVAPGKDVAPPPETVVAPGKDVAPPPETEVALGKDVAPPPETVVAPGKDMAPPPETEVAPGKDMAPPPETVVAPGKDVAPPPETEVAPGKAGPLPPETETPLAKDVAPPSEAEGAPVPVKDMGIARTPGKLSEAFQLASLQSEGPSAVPASMISPEPGTAGGQFSVPTDKAPVLEEPEQSKPFSGQPSEPAEPAGTLPTQAKQVCRPRDRRVARPRPARVPPELLGDSSRKTLDPGLGPCSLPEAGWVSGSFSCAEPGNQRKTIHDDLLETQRDLGREAWDVDSTAMMAKKKKKKPKQKRYSQPQVGGPWDDDSAKEAHGHPSAADPQKPGVLPSQSATVGVKYGLASRESPRKDCGVDSRTAALAAESVVSERPRVPSCPSEEPPKAAVSSQLKLSTEAEVKGNKSEPQSQGRDSLQQGECRPQTAPHLASPGGEGQEVGPLRLKGPLTEVSARKTEVPLEVRAQEDQEAMGRVLKPPAAKELPNPTRTLTANNPLESSLKEGNDERTMATLQTDKRKEFSEAAEGVKELNKEAFPSQGPEMSILASEQLPQGRSQVPGPGSDPLKRTAGDGKSRKGRGSSGKVRASSGKAKARAELPVLPDSQDGRAALGPSEPAPKTEGTIAGGSREELRLRSSRQPGTTAALPEAVVKGAPKETDPKAVVKGGPKETDREAVVKGGPKETDREAVVKGAPKETDREAVVKGAPKETDREEVVKGAPKETDREAVVKGGPKETDREAVVKGAPKETDREEVVKGAPKETDREAVVKGGPKETDREAVVKGAPKETDREAVVKGAPKETDREAVVKGGPKETDREAVVKGAPKETDREAVVKGAPKETDPKAVVKGRPKETDREAVVKGAPKETDREAVVKGAPKETDREAVVKGAPKETDPEAVVKGAPKETDREAVVKGAPKETDPEAVVKGGPKETDREAVVKGALKETDPKAVVKGRPKETDREAVVKGAPKETDREAVVKGALKETDREAVVKGAPKETDREAVVKGAPKETDREAVVKGGPKETDCEAVVKGRPKETDREAVVKGGPKETDREAVVKGAPKETDREAVVKGAPKETDRGPKETDPEAVVKGGPKETDPSAASTLQMLVPLETRSGMTPPSGAAADRGAVAIDLGVSKQSREGKCPWMDREAAPRVSERPKKRSSEGKNKKFKSNYSAQLASGESKEEALSPPLPGRDGGAGGTAHQHKDSGLTLPMSHEPLCSQTAKAPTVEGVDRKGGNTEVNSVELGALGGNKTNTVKDSAVTEAATKVTAVSCQDQSQGAGLVPSVPPAEQKAEAAQGHPAGRDSPGKRSDDGKSKENKTDATKRHVPRAATGDHRMEGMGHVDENRNITFTCPRTPSEGMSRSAPPRALDSAACEKLPAPSPQLVKGGESSPGTLAESRQGTALAPASELVVGHCSKGGVPEQARAAASSAALPFTSPGGGALALAAAAEAGPRPGDSCLENRGELADPVENGAGRDGGHVGGESESVPRGAAKHPGEKITEPAKGHRPAVPTEAQSPPRELGGLGVRAGGSHVPASPVNTEREAEEGSASGHTPDFPGDKAQKPLFCEDQNAEGRGSRGPTGLNKEMDMTLLTPKSEKDKSEGISLASEITALADASLPAPELQSRCVDGQAGAAPASAVGKAEVTACRGLQLPEPKEKASEAPEDVAAQAEPEALGDGKREEKRVAEPLKGYMRPTKSRGLPPLSPKAPVQERERPKPATSRGRNLPGCVCCGF
ncbi:hypothetical protein QTO34_007413 [Cnephaeus nilssonii]|uniref:Microtubule-associated protein n=1 Tax=Cnephaeus nilssonii TaxID=3371016 RepID=A0AA40LHA5_CNENI|nr:hypothetical protein QTO34_007413 [Eptesicus nilssonii]